MAAGKTPKNKKIFDVSKPGKTAPSASSKPVIIGHKSMLKDPMVKEDNPAGLIMLTDPDDKPAGSPPPAPAETGPLTAPVLKNTTIKPLADQAKKQPAKSSVEVIKDQPPADDGSDTNSTQPADEGDQPDVSDTSDNEVNDDQPEELPVSPDKKTVDEPPANDEPKADTNEQDEKPATKNDEAAAINMAAQQTEQKKQQDKLAQEQAARRTAMEKLIAEKKYFVPIGVKTRRKRSVRRSIIGILLIILMGAMLVNLVLDVGLIQTDVKPPVPIFNR